jgi:hypothetical protein
MSTPGRPLPEWKLALVPRGWRLRVSIAGHDADNFARIPAEGDPVITVERNRLHASYLELPVVGWKSD